MVFRVVLILLLFGGVVSVSFGQSSRDVDAPAVPAPRYMVKKAKKATFFSRIFKKKTNHITGIEETKDFERRMKATVRKKARESKKAMLPQYSDPSYFGHKKPPKKRPNGKKKFCKECGLVH